MRSKFFTSFIFLLGSYLFVMMCSSCKDENNNNYASNIVFPDTGTISFTKHVYPLFQQACTPSCHSGSSPAADLDLDNDSQTCWETIEYSSMHLIVVPKNPSASLLYTRITGAGGLTRMPPEKYSALTTNQIDGIKRWINQGALPN
jgi:hypothetical protein